MFNINLYNCCLDEINKLTSNINRNRYKVIYSNEYYLQMIFNVFNDINNWKSLSKLKDYKSNFKFHYKTIHNKYKYWCDNNIFKNAFYNYKSKFNTNLLLIDATSINNKFGTENITINPEYKKKKITKLSIITNKQGFIYSIIPFDIKNNNHNNHNYSTAVHDVKMINKSINSIKNINNNSKYFTLIGDKAYKSKELFKLNNKKINIITPDKKNSIKKNNYFSNKKLKCRIKVENTIGNIKKYERVMLRKDKKLNYFMGWIYISSLMNNLKYQ